MSFKNVLDDIDEVQLTELKGSPALPSEASFVKVDASGNFSTATDGGGGGGGGGGVTSYTDVYSEHTNPNTFTLDAGGRYRVMTSCTHNAGRFWQVTSGFNNIVGGWYRGLSGGDSDNSSTFRVYGQYYNSGFDVFMQGQLSTTSSGVSNTRWTEGNANTNTGVMTGNTTYRMFQVANGFWEGEFLVGSEGDVVWSLVAAPGLTALIPSNTGVRVSVTKLTQEIAMASLADFIKENHPSPTDGDNFIWGGVRYTYDATPGIWAGALPQPDALTDGAATSTTAPEDPEDGDLWFDGAKLNVRVGDVWEDANPQPTAEDLGVVSTIVVGDGSATVQDVSQVNFSSASADTPRIEVSDGSGGVANVLVYFPNPPELPEADVPAVPTNTVQGTSTNFVTNKPADNGDPSWVPLADAVSSESINSFSDVSAGSATDGQLLTYNSTSNSWVAANPPSGPDAVTVAEDGKSVTIGTDTTQIPVVTSGTAGGALTLMTNDGDNVTIDLSGIVSGLGLATAEQLASLQQAVDDGAEVPEVTFDKLNLVVGGNENINTINVGGDLTVTSDATGVVTLISNTVVPTPSFEVREDGTTRSMMATTINFTGNGVAVTNAGNGVVNVEVTDTVGESSGGMAASEEATAVAAITNIEKQGNLTNYFDQANRKVFSLTGNNVGGSKHKAMVSAPSTGNHQFKWSTSVSPTSVGTDPANNINALSFTSDDTHGIWDPVNKAVRLLGDGVDLLWKEDTNISAAGGVFTMDLDLPPNGRITFTTNSNDVKWYSTSLTADTDSLTQVNVPEPTPDMGGGDMGGEDPGPAPDPADAPVTQGDTTPGWEGLYSAPGVGPEADEGGAAAATPFLGYTSSSFGGQKEDIFDGGNLWYFDPADFNNSIAEFTAWAKTVKSVEAPALQSAGNQNIYQWDQTSRREVSQTGSAFADASSGFITRFDMTGDPVDIPGGGVITVSPEEVPDFWGSSNRPFKPYMFSPTPANEVVQTELGWTRNTIEDQTHANSFKNLLTDANDSGDGSLFIFTPRQFGESFNVFQAWAAEVKTLVLPSGVEVSVALGSGGTLDLTGSGVGTYGRGYQAQFRATESIAASEFENLEVVSVPSWFTTSNTFEGNYYFSTGDKGMTGAGEGGQAGPVISEEGDLTWSDDNLAAYEKVAFDPLTGGDGESSPASTNGNLYWGTNPNRSPAGIWVEAWGNGTFSNTRQLGVSVLLPHVDDDVIGYLDNVASSQTVWNGHSAVYQRDDSSLGRREDGILNPSQKRRFDLAGYAHGTRLNLLSASGPNKGPFSDQYLISAAYVYDVHGFPYDWNTTRTTGLLDSEIIHQTTSMAFNVPNDPDNAVIHVRRRGTPSGNIKKGRILQGDDRDNVFLYFLQSDFQSAGSSHVQEQRDVFDYYARSLTGSQLDIPGVGVVTIQAMRSTTLNGALYGAWVYFDREVDTSTVTLETDQLIGTYNPTAGHAAVNNWSVEINAEPDMPIEIVTDNTNSEVQAHIWQIEYMLVK